MIKLLLDLPGNNSDNVKTTTHPIRESLASDEGGVYVSTHGVFHPSGLEVIHDDTNAPLVLDVDYYLIYYSKHLAANYDITGFGGIVLVNKTLTGNLRITANYLGGGYSKFNSTAILDVVTLVGGAPENIYWDMMVDAPAKAYPNGHSLPAENISTGYEDYVSVLWQLSKQLENLSAIKYDNAIPIGTMLPNLGINNNLNTNYWILCTGQTITKTDYYALFKILGITSDAIVLPDAPFTYLRVN